MDTRFDDIELLRIETELEPALPVRTPPAPARPVMEVPVAATAGTAAPRWRRMVAFLIDLSLFAALAIAMSPLLPPFTNWEKTLTTDVFAVSAFPGFILLVSYYYFVGTWVIWGKTIGGALLEVRVISRGADGVGVRSMTRRWAFTLIGAMTGGLLFVPALFPSRLSIPDRISGTRCVRG